MMKLGPEKIAGVMAFRLALRRLARSVKRGAALTSAVRWLTAGLWMLLMTACVMPPPAADTRPAGPSDAVQAWEERLADRDPLFAAVATGQTARVQTALEAGGDVRARDFWGDTPLHEAVAVGQPDVVTLLLAHGADPAQRNHAGTTPLALLDFRYRPQLFPILWQALSAEEQEREIGASWQVGAPWSLDDPATSWPLLRAVQQGDLDTLEFLLDRNIHDAAAPEVHTALVDALLHNQGAIATLLLDAIQGAQGPFDAPRLWQAAHTQDLRQLLRDAGIPVRAAELRLADKFAGGQYLQLEQMCRWGAAGILCQAATDPGYWGNTPLHTGAALGDPDLLASALAATTDLNARDRWGDTPLHEAARAGHVRAVTLLLAQGAQVDPRNQAGETPLLQAAREGRREVMALLLQAKADPNHQAAAGHTPLAVAVEHGQPQAVAFLLDHGVDPDLGFPLSRALHRNDESLSRALLQAGADPNRAHPAGRVPLQDAVFSGVLIDRLLAAGARAQIPPMTYPPYPYHLDRRAWQALLRAGADPAAVLGYHLLVDPRLVELWLAYGADPNLDALAVCGLSHYGLPLLNLLNWGGLPPDPDFWSAERLTVLDLLLSYGADPLHPTSPPSRRLGYHPHPVLTHLAAHGDAPQALLLQHGVTVAQWAAARNFRAADSRPNPEPYGALGAAIAENDPVRVKTLLSARPLADWPLPTGESWLGLALDTLVSRTRDPDTMVPRPDANPAIVRLLLAHGANPDSAHALQAALRPGSWYGADSPETSPLAWLLEAGADPNARIGCYSLLQYALFAHRRPNISAVLFLLDQGADPSGVAPAGTLDPRLTLSPLMLAVLWDLAPLVQTLLEAGADTAYYAPYGESVHSALSLVLNLEEDAGISQARQLLAAGASPDLQDPAGRTVLHLAAAQGRAKLVRLLLEAGARVDIRDQRGHTPAMYSATPEIWSLFCAGPENGARPRACF